MNSGIGIAFLPGNPKHFGAFTSASKQKKLRTAASGSARKKIPPPKSEVVAHHQIDTIGMALHSVHIFAGAVQVFGRKLTAWGQIPENIAEDILAAAVFVIGIGPVPAANLCHGITA